MTIRAAPDNAVRTAKDHESLTQFMSQLGQAYLACGEQTAEVELLLRRIGSAHGIPRSRIVAFPTAVFIALHDGVEERVTLAEGPAEMLRLDQIADVYALGDAALRAAVTPSEGLDRLADILCKTARFGPTGVLVGHTILTVGVAMLLLPTLTHLAAAALLGAIVGTTKLLNQKRAVLAVPMPVIAATLVSVLVFWAVRRGLPVDPLHVLVPPLVTFLPGALGLISVTRMLTYAERSRRRARWPRHCGIRARIDRAGDAGRRVPLQGADRAVRLVAIADRPRRIVRPSPAQALRVRPSPPDLWCSRSTSPAWSRSQSARASS